MNPNDASQPHSELSPRPGEALASAGFPRDISAPQRDDSSTQTAQPPAAPGGDMYAPQAGQIKSGNEQWIAAAKNIIDSTADDPYAQTELLYELRTQFMQQVHSRSLKRKDTGAK